MSGLDIPALADRATPDSVIELPFGSFDVSRSIELPDNAILAGKGSGTVLTFTESMDLGITNRDRTNGNTGIRISNLRLDGADLCNDPIELVKCTDSIIDNIWVKQGNHDGIELQSCTRCIVSNCIAHDSNTFNGIELDSCNDCTVTDCIAYNNVTGIEIDGTSDGCLVYGGLVRDSSSRGVSFSTNTTNNVMMGTHLSGNTTNVVDGGTDNSILWSRGSNLHIQNANFKGDYVFLPCPASAVADSNISPNRVSFWLNEGENALTFRVKLSDNSLKTGTVALT